MMIRYMAVEWCGQWIAAVQAENHYTKGWLNTQAEAETWIKNKDSPSWNTNLQGG